MKRRGYSIHTTLGNNTSLIDGKPTTNKKLNNIINLCSKDMYNVFLKHTTLDYGYCDAQYTPESVTIGVEPSYMYERLKIIVISKDIQYSKFITGYARGMYGTEICKTEKCYKDYKNYSKFIKFIKKWHKQVFPTEC